MSKYVLQTFHITDGFLQGIRQKASIYPEDINLAKVRVSWRMMCWQAESHGTTIVLARTRHLRHAEIKYCIALRHSFHLAPVTCTIALAFRSRTRFVVYGKYCTRELYCIR